MLEPQQDAGEYCRLKEMDNPLLLLRGDLDRGWAFAQQGLSVAGAVFGNGGEIRTMESDVLVRHADSADIPAIYHVVRASRREAFAGLLPEPALGWPSAVTDEFRAFVRSAIASERRALLVAARDGAVVGLADLAWGADSTGEFVAADEAELEMIHVQPANWDEGIGTALLEVALETPPADVAGVALCVLTDNERARAFYERRGFEHTGTTVTTYADTDVTEAVYRRSR